MKATLVEAFRGAYAVFAVTNYWEKMDTNLEIQQGKNLADAAVVRSLLIKSTDVKLTMCYRKLASNTLSGALC